MTGFWDGVYHGIKNETLPQDVLLRLIDAIHELDHGSHHEATDWILENISKEDYDVIMEIQRKLGCAKIITKCQDKSTSDSRKKNQDETRDLDMKAFQLMNENPDMTFTGAIHKAKELTRIRKAKKKKE